MRTSGRSGPDRPGHAGTEAADEPASVRTTPDRGACTCPVKALVAKRDRRACSTGSTSSSAVRSLSMVPCTSSFETGSNEASIRPSRPRCRPPASGWRLGSRRSSVRSRCSRRGRGSGLPCLQRGCGSARKLGPRSLGSGRLGHGAPDRARCAPGHRHPAIELHLWPPSGPCRERCCSEPIPRTPNHDRGCRNGWALAQNAVWFA
jgi:hypothetical protein